MQNSLKIHFYSNYILFCRNKKSNNVLPLKAVPRLSNHIHLTHPHHSQLALSAIANAKENVNTSNNNNSYKLLTRQPPLWSICHHPSLSYPQSVKHPHQPTSQHDPHHRQSSINPHPLHRPPLHAPHEVAIKISRAHRLQLKCNITCSSSNNSTIIVRNVNVKGSVINSNNNSSSNKLKEINSNNNSSNSNNTQQPLWQLPLNWAPLDCLASTI